MSTMPNDKPEPLATVNRTVQTAKPISPACHDTEKQSGRRLSWRGFAVRKNFSYCRRKIIDPGAGYDDAVSAAMSFLGDAQEPPALIFSELDVEVLAFNLEFSRFDDVIHFTLRTPSLESGRRKWKKNSRF